MNKRAVCACWSNSEFPGTVCAGRVTTRGEAKSWRRKSCWNFKSSRQTTKSFLRIVGLWHARLLGFFLFFWRKEKLALFAMLSGKNFSFQRKWFMRVFIVSSSSPPTPSYRFLLFSLLSYLSPTKQDKQGMKSSVWLIKLISSLKQLGMFRSDLSKHLRHEGEEKIECVNNNRHCRYTLDCERDEIWDAAIASRRLLILARSSVVLFFIGFVSAWERLNDEHVSCVSDESSVSFNACIFLCYINATEAFHWCG